MSPSILPSILHAYPTPSHSMHPHTIKDPPPNFRVPSTSLSFKFSPGFFHTHFLPSDPNLLILVSSDHTTFFQSSTVQCWWAKAKSILAFLCLLERKGFFFFTTGFNPASLRPRCTVWAERGWLVTFERTLATSTAVSAFPELMRHWA